VYNPLLTVISGLNNDNANVLECHPRQIFWRLQIRKWLVCYCLRFIHIN